MSYTSTIDSTIPATNSPGASAPMRAQFQAAITDINYLGANYATLVSPVFTTPSLGSATATTPSPGDNTTKVATTAFVETALASSSANPSGTIISFAANTPPTGYLECNGSAISRTTHATLFGVIGTTFGSGDGSTTFNIPDLRGYFVRGWADAGSIDPSRVFGSTQSDAFASHTHTLTDPGHVHAIVDQLIVPGTGIAGGSGHGASSENTASSTTGISIASTGGTETRPVNVALMYCIKT